MKKIIQTTALVLVMSLPALGHGREIGDAKFESKESILKVLPKSDVKEKGEPAMKAIRKVEKRIEVLRSNGRLERLYSFSISL
jgi:hypothetical protein